MGSERRGREVRKNEKGREEEMEGRREKKRWKGGERRRDGGEEREEEMEERREKRRETLGREEQAGITKGKRNTVSSTRRNTNRLLEAWFSICWHIS